MSEVRFPSHPMMVTPHHGGFSSGSNTLSRVCLPESPGGQGLLTTGSPQQFFNSNSTYLSNPLGGASLIQMQADTAGAITGGGQSKPSEGADGFKITERVFRAGDAVASSLGAGAEVAGNGVSRLGRSMGVLGPGFGVFAEAASLPGGFNTARDSWNKARETGDTMDYVRFGGDGAAFASAGTSLVKGVLEVPEAYVRGNARLAATNAFRQAAPNASKAVVNAAAREAADQALKDSVKAKEARRAVQDKALETAKKKGTIAGGAGMQGRSAAKAALREGGKEAAEAAGKVVASSALKTAAKAGARFVPGLNVGIAALDSATAAATLADPEASVGKKATSVITAAGSIVAATNIPIVSQVGAAVSAVSSFIGSFF